jgi:hypothetical protein
MVFSIPISSTDAAYSIDVELDGSTYALDFAYSERSSLWFLSVYFLANSERVPVFVGVAMIADYPLLAGCVHDHRPLGELRVRCDRDPGRNDLGSFAQLLYHDAAEFTT